MAYVNVSDERFFNGQQYSAGVFDAPAGLNSSYTLAEGLLAYGTLVDDYILRDVDVYDLGVLQPGTYLVDVDDFTWDFSNFDTLSVSSFSVLNGFGGIVETEFSTSFDIVFEVASSGRYYLEIEGPVVEEAQYTAAYYLVGSNTPAVWGSASYMGNLWAGSKLSASVEYFDADGNSDGLVLTGWHLGSEFLGYSDTLILIESDVGQQLGVSFGFSDDLGNPELSPVYTIGTVGLSNLQGTSGNDTLSGTSSDDDLFGFSGNDRLMGGQANDFLDGGPGVDTAVYSGNQNSYVLFLGPEGTALVDRRTSGDGTDELVNIEILDFEIDLLGQPFDLRQFGGPATLTGDQLESFIELYIAYFNRAPDAIGLNFWGTAFANGTTLEEMASLFVGQPETLATYPAGTSNQDFAISVYNNVLGRTPDQAGIDFWVGLLDNGGVRRDEFILRVLEGAKADLKPEEGQEFVDQQLADRAYLENKTDIGAYFAVHKGMSDVENAATAMALFNGSQSSLNSAVAAIDSYFEAALDPIAGEFLMPLVGVLDDPFSI